MQAFTNITKAFMKILWGYSICCQWLRWSIRNISRCMEGYHPTSIRLRRYSRSIGLRRYPLRESYAIFCGVIPRIRSLIVGHQIIQDNVLTTLVSNKQGHSWAEIDSSSSSEVIRCNPKASSTKRFPTFHLPSLYSPLLTMLRPIRTRAQ